MFSGVFDVFARFAFSSTTETTNASFLGPRWDGIALAVARITRCAALPISARRRAPGIELDPSRLIHIRLSAAPDGGQSDGPCHRFPSGEAAGSASSGKSPE